jgi:hypothetical protein
VIEMTATAITTFVKRFQCRKQVTAGAALSALSVLLLSGCSSSFSNAFHGTVPQSSLVVSGLHGKTHGGQYPVSGSTVQVYAVAAAGAGYGAATTALGTPVTTDQYGGWTYGDFTCASGNDELYVVSSGGNPGLTPSVNSPSLELAAALGTCNYVQAGNPSFVFIDEVTTVAMEYALAGFATDTLHIGTSATNYVGLSNAFATANNLVNVTTGQAYTNTPAYNTPPTPPSGGEVPNDTFRSIVPYDLINTLANIIASCVNTDGDTNSGSACYNLFAITGGSQAQPIGNYGVTGPTATNTADAVLYIAHNPGLPSVSFSNSNTAALFDLIMPSAPFGPALTAAPNDYTMTVNFVGGGLGGVKTRSDSGGTLLTIDGSGNIWVPNTRLGTVTELNNLGAPLSQTTIINSSSVDNYPVVYGGYLGGGSTSTGDSPIGIAVDLSSPANIWVSDGNECLYELNSSGALNTALGTGGYITTACPDTPEGGIAVDTSNNVWIQGETFISAVQNANGEAVFPPITSGFTALVANLGVDYTGHVWFIDGGTGHYGYATTGGTVPFLSSAELSEPNSSWAFGAYTGSNNNGGLSMWSPSSGNQDVQPVEITGTSAQINTFPQQLLPDATWSPADIAADGNSRYYYTNLGGESDRSNTDVPSNINVFTSGETEVSPFYNGYTGGSALMALDNPEGIAIDQSGNVWVVNANNANNGTAPIGGGTYLGNGIDAANVTEFVGLAAPTNPVFAYDAGNGGYGTLP